MIFSYNLLQSFFSRKLPKPDKLAELLTLHSFEVSEVKKFKSDHVLDIDVLPNRAGDCFSHVGIAREIAAITNYVPAGHLPKGDKLPKNKENSAKDFISVDIRSQSYCPRYTARVIGNIKVVPSPKWLKDSLAACGLNSINNVVDVANYVMLETGQPLHVFDYEKLDSKKIIVRFAKEGEKITALDGQKFDLNPKILVIADGQKPVAIAGIKGGKEPEINEMTKTIVLESANFNPTIIRKGSRELNLKTDASVRFEHGIDVNLTESAINRAAYLIQKTALGKPFRDSVDFYPQKVYPKKIKLDLNYAESLLGAKIPEREIRNILMRLGFKVIGVRNQLSVEIPTFRLDISIPEDLIEEIGRIYGYDKILPVFPTASLIPPKINNDMLWENQIKDILKEAGFTETYNYSFQKELGSVEVENPTSQEFKYLRPSLIPNLLKNIEKNIKSFNQIKIFEVGKIFYDKTEKRMLAGVAAGQDFYQIKGAMDLLFDKLGIVKVWYDDYQATPEIIEGKIWHHLRLAEIKIGDETFGFIGEINPNVIGNYDIDGRVAMFEIDFEKLACLANEDFIYSPISKFPAIERDLAILTPINVKVDDVLNVLENIGGQLLINTDLFDVYEGDNIQEGKKSLAFHLIFQSRERTLSDKEVDEILAEIIVALSEEGWEIRR